VPVVWTMADHFGLSRVLVDDRGEPPATFHTIWMLLSRDPAVLSGPAIRAAAKPLAGYTTRLRMWTDEYSDLFQILK